MDQDAQLAIQELLRDLGWLPSDLKCEEKKRLAQEYLDATVTWLQMSEGPRLKILGRLPQSYKGLLQGALRQYEKLVPAINEARMKAARAQLALQAHMANHNC